jgi:tetratricopeptide (TPR) repeat protein
MRLAVTGGFYRGRAPRPRNGAAQSDILEVKHKQQDEPASGFATSGRPREETALNSPLDEASGTGTLAAGDVLAGRFRILAFLGEGAIGEVYEAEDLELSGRLAVKTLHPAIARDERALARFKREVHLARQVTHPNVCRLFELSYHHRELERRAGDREGGLAFLTMELLRGETLAARLARQGRMTTAEALPLACQMAEGLAAAHAAGVVHRDFKSGNVILVPVSGGTRAVITDFGMARSSTAPSSLTGTGTLVGSPAYMSPEQVSGEEVTAASDVYSLGLVLYEMVTGTLPFTGSTAFQIALKRLHEPPAPPRSHVPGLDPHWEAVVLRCLERQPADRFADAAEVARALAGEAVAPAPRHSRRRRRQRWALAGVALGVLLVGLALLLPLWHRDAAPGSPVAGSSATSATRAVSAPARLRRTSVAVLGFQNLSRNPRSAYIEKVLFEMLPTELSGGGKLLSVPGEEVERMRRDLALAEATSLGRDTLARVREALGADLVVTGSYLVVPQPAGDEVRLDLRVQSTATGETVATLKELGREERFLDVLGSLGSRLRRTLGAGELSAAEAEGLRAALPANTEAAQLYAQGLAALRLANAPGALRLLERAAAADPDNPRLESALAAAWSALGYDRKAEEHARRALARSAGLPPEEQQSIEAGVRAIAGEWEKAAVSYRALWEQFPDNLEHGLRLAAVETEGGSGRAALATVEELRRLPPPLGDDPRIDLAAAAAAGSLSDFKRQQAEATRAAEKAAARGARGMVAAARYLEGQALQGLSQWDLARVAYDESLRIYRATGDRLGEVRSLHADALLLRARGDTSASQGRLAEALGSYRAIGSKKGEASALCDLGQVLLEQGNFPAAGQRFEEALAIFSEINDKQGTIRALARLGSGLRQQGDLEGARARYETALRIARDIGNRNQEVKLLNNLAYVARTEGDFAGAEKRLAEVLAVFHATGDRRSAASVLSNLGILLSDQGKMTAARQRHEEAMALCREIGWKSGTAVELHHLADVDRYQDHLAEARKENQEALEIRNALGESGPAAESRLAQAEVSLAAGQPGEAAALAREAAEEFQTAKALDSEAEAAAVRARALVALGDLAGAAPALERAVTLARKSKDDNVRLAVAIAAAVVEAARGKAGDAARHLAAALRSERWAGLPPRLEAGLALGRIEIAAHATGDTAAGRRRLEKVEREARAARIDLIARLAREGPRG